MLSRNRKELLVRVVAAAGICAGMMWMTSCARQESDQQIQRQAEQATEQAKVAAKKAAANAKVAAAEAERDMNDVAAGVKAGMHNGKTTGGEVNLNSASRADLESLPGVTPATARKIVDNRPYASPHDLVSKGVVTHAEYERIAGDVVTQ